MTTQKNEYGCRLPSNKVRQLYHDERCQGVSVPRVIDFMAWQLATTDRGAGHRSFGAHPVRSKCSHSAIVCEEMMNCLDNSNPLNKDKHDGVYLIVVRDKGYDE